MGDRDAVKGLTVRIVDDVEMSELHLAFMSLAGPTDVLAFAAEWPEGAPGPHPLGDIVLDWDAIGRQARAPDEQSRVEEAVVLAVHGLAHLLGHDHADRSEGRRMHQLEARVLRRLGVPDVPRPYDPGSVAVRAF
jgi:probable rRNA maturation factor